MNTFIRSPWLQIWHIIALMLLAACTGTSMSKLVITPSAPPTKTINVTETQPTTTPYNTLIPPTEIIKPTITASPKPTLIPSVDDRLIPHSYYSLIPEGQYVVYVKFLGDKTALYVVSIQGDINQRLTDWVSNNQAEDISFDGKKIAYVIGPDGENTRLYVLETVEDTFREIQSGKNCLVPGWSPDNEMLVVYCDSKTYVISLITDSKTAINAGEGLSFDFNIPVWSPDGEWIANISGPIHLSLTTTDGLYITATNCINAPNTCQAKTRGPISKPERAYHGPLAWSPDSHSLVIADSFLVFRNSLQIVNIDTLTRIALIHDIFATGLAWSPIEDSIAFSNDNDIYLITSQGGDQHYWLRMRVPLKVG